MASYRRLTFNDFQICTAVGIRRVSSDNKYMAIYVSLSSFLQKEATYSSQAVPDFVAAWKTFQTGISFVIVRDEQDLRPISWRLSHSF